MRTFPVVFRALTGETHTLVAGKDSTVGDMQESLCALFGKRYPETKVSIVSYEVLHAEFPARPFRSMATRSEARVLFARKVCVSSGEIQELAVQSEASLREMQLLLCRICRKSFPAMKATLIVGENVYDEFMQVPFQDCSGSVEATVTFNRTDDPYFYDLRDRRQKQAGRGSSPERFCLR